MCSSLPHECRLPPQGGQALRPNCNCHCTFLLLSWHVDMHAVQVLDLPMLVNDGGQLLQSELKVGLQLSLLLLQSTGLSACLLND